ncbi:DNA-protecting protein DprA [Terrilactibacillus sp. BCM23-1]|uniref:DNA-protecting protein DprA n=1 Tax=Terrilactibacillus tamarindi TaxID=2599694 RepID=A0A6N8CQI0_9BACI|nr:DNA-processing protein DprA [Terrilactibacillus tamarindi]MTT32291.1 DNA-protecting protein DprA [Terrilactibacillus tamarindi]
MNKRSWLIYLHHCQSVTNLMLRKILFNWDHLGPIDTWSDHEIKTILRLSHQRFAQFKIELERPSMNEIEKEYQNNHIQIVTILDDDYPFLLKKIFDPPIVLYVKGSRSFLNDHKLLSVVGTRHPSSYAKKCMEKVLLPLVKEKWTIVSGLAIGVDTLAHHIGLKSKTIAVLGSGLYHPYPSQNQPLFEEIARKHVVISEYPPSRYPRKWQFPERNRIISGLSKATIIVEAKERSGSLITADQALEQGREVLAIPGSILEPNARGTNKLIQQGAKLVMDSDDILSEIRY